MGIDKYNYTVGDATYTAFISRVEKQSKGYNAVSLSNYDATGVCVITDGSAFEVAGSMYLCTTDTSITASVATGICYIMATGATATATVAWSTTAPVWRDDFQGYYATAASSVRAIGGCYFDGASYEAKWIYNKRDSGPITRYLSPAFDGGTYTSVANQGRNMTFSGAATGYVALNFPLYQGIITAIQLYTDSASTDSGTFHLYRGALTSFVGSSVVSINYNAGAPDPSSSTITEPLIKTETYQYVGQFDTSTVDGTLIIEGLQVTYTEIKR